MVTFFNDAGARNYLIAHGKVYTIRPKGKRTGHDVARWGDFYHFITIGEIHITRIVDTLKSPDDLKPYANESGQPGPIIWYAKAAQKFKGEPMSLFLADLVKPTHSVSFFKRVKKP